MKKGWGFFRGIPTHTLSGTEVRGFLWGHSSVKWAMALFLFYPTMFDSVSMVLMTHFLHTCCCLLRIHISHSLSASCGKSHNLLELWKCGQSIGQTSNALLTLNRYWYSPQYLVTSEPVSFCPPFSIYSTLHVVQPYCLTHCPCVST